MDFGQSGDSPHADFIGFSLTGDLAVCPQEGGTTSQRIRIPHIKLQMPILEFDGQRRPSKTRPGHILLREKLDKSPARLECHKAQFCPPAQDSGAAGYGQRNPPVPGQIDL